VWGGDLKSDNRAIRSRLILDAREFPAGKLALKDARRQFRAWREKKTFSKKNTRKLGKETPQGKLGTQSKRGGGKKVLRENVLQIITGGSTSSPTRHRVENGKT